MGINIKAYGTSHLTTYLINIENKNFMFDFFCSDCSEEDLKELDYIFLSHEHLDHIGSLFDYQLIQKLNKNVRIFSTKTTKDLITYYFETLKFIDEAKEIISYFINKIEVCYFDEELILDNNIKLTLYRSGHTFGSAMAYVKTDTTSILYTGDIDYSTSNAYRQYDLPYHIDVNYLIADGTKLFGDFYKGVTYKNVYEYIANSNKKVIQYKARPEKAIFYALYLAEKIDNCVFVYNDYMKWYLKAIVENGYNPYVKDKVMFRLKQFIEADEEVSEDKKTIDFVDEDNKYDIDYKLSLHISKNDFLKMIDEHFSKNPIAIFIGHYSLDIKEINNLNLDNAYLLKKGGNSFE